MILLDTHIFLWMHLEPDKVPRSMTEAIAAELTLGIAAITLWETAMLVRRKRVSIPDASLLEWFRVTLPITGPCVLPLTPEMAARSEVLEMHGDPADRPIAATALEHGCRLATVDSKLVGLGWLETAFG